MWQSNKKTSRRGRQRNDIAVCFFCKRTGSVFILLSVAVGSSAATQIVLTLLRHRSV